MSSSSNEPSSDLSPTAGPSRVDLDRDYGLTVSTLIAHPGGFESEGWVADGTWFVKVWRQASPVAAPDSPPGGLGILRELQVLGLPVPAPVPTLAGNLHASWNGRPYAVFPYIQGRPATDADWQLSARALRRVHAATPTPTSLPLGSLDESDVHLLAGHLDHPWIADRATEVAAAIERLDDAVHRAHRNPVRRVLCHTDFISLNLIVDDDQRIAAILDWDNAVLAPREHDVWIAAETRDLEGYLTEYGSQDLNLDQLEYALLSRALRDLTARVLSEVDRPGVQTWGFDRLARLDDDLARFRPFCAGP